jgi:hypothetical protein
VEEAIREHGVGTMVGVKPDLKGAWLVSALWKHMLLSVLQSPVIALAEQISDLPSIGSSPGCTQPFSTPKVGGIKGRLFLTLKDIQD